MFFYYCALPQDVCQRMCFRLCLAFTAFHVRHWASSTQCSTPALFAVMLVHVFKAVINLPGFRSI